MAETTTEQPMKIYLASRYSRRDEMLGVAEALEMFGHEVTARWIQGDHQISDEGLSVEAKAIERERFAVEDMSDLMAADCCISFTEEPRKTATRGGRHVEFGVAIATGKRCIVVGPRENVFHCLPQVEVYDSVRALFYHIEKPAAMWSLAPAGAE